MAKDKLIKMRASDYDKAVVQAIAQKVDEEKSFTTKTSESDVVRMAIASLVMQYLDDKEIAKLRAEHMFKNAK